MTRKPPRRPVPPATALRDRAGTLARRVRRRLHRFGAVLGRLAEEAAIRLTGTTAAFGSTHPSPMADPPDRSAGTRKHAMAPSPRDPSEAQPAATATPDPTPETAGASDAAAPAAAPVRPNPGANTPEPTDANASPTHAPPAHATGPQTHPAAEATPDPSAAAAPAPFPLEERLHTWLYSARAPSALQILPIEPRRAWCWWRLDEADRTRVAGKRLTLEVLDGAGTALQRHGIDSAEGEFFVTMDRWRPRISARLIAEDPSGHTLRILMAAPAGLPPESPGDQAIRWTFSVHRGDHVRGLPAERQHPDLPAALTARLTGGDAPGAGTGARTQGGAAGRPANPTHPAHAGGLPSSADLPLGARAGSHALPIGAHTAPPESAAAGSDR